MQRPSWQTPWVPQTTSLQGSLSQEEKAPARRAVRANALNKFFIVEIGFNFVKKLVCKYTHCLTISKAFVHLRLEKREVVVQGWFTMLFFCLFEQQFALP
jgi:hypothetical protein